MCLSQIFTSFSSYNPGRFLRFLSGLALEAFGYLAVVMGGGGVAYGVVDVGKEGVEGRECRAGIVVCLAQVERDEAAVHRVVRVREIEICEPHAHKCIEVVGFLPDDVLEIADGTHIVLQCHVGKSAAIECGQVVGE